MNRNRFPSMAILALALSPALLSAQAADPASTGDAALAKADSFRAFNDTGFSYDFATKDDGGETSLMRVSVRLGGDEAALVRYLEPSKQRGQAVLVRGNVFWLHQPGMKRALRISPRQILFGQASAGDISRISFRAMYSVASSGEAGGLTLLGLKAKPGANATYDFVDLYVDANCRPVKAICKGKSGTAMKTISYESYERIAGKELLTEFTLVDEIGKKRERMKLSNFDPSIPPAGDFSVQALSLAQ